MYLDDLQHNSHILLSIHLDAFRWKEEGLREEACFLSEALKVQEVEAHAVAAGCGRDVAGLLRASICEVLTVFSSRSMSAMTSASLQRCNLRFVFS